MHLLTRLYGILSYIIISIHTRYHTHTPTEEKYGREVVVIPVDFSDGMEIYPNIAEQLNDLDIGVLGMQLAKIYCSALIVCYFEFSLICSQ